jgi:4-hydroxy-3-polyprenylbenzoate decarboxylase
VARESPLSLIDLRNLVTLAEAGATIMPAAPAFYSNPKTIDELADYFVVRVLDQIGVRVEHAGRWGG